MHYLVVARNGFETVAMSATSLDEAERIRDGFVEDNARRVQRATRETSASIAMAVLVDADVVILSRAHAGTLYREG